MARDRDQSVTPLRQVSDDLAPEVAQELSHLIPALWKVIPRATPAYKQMPVLESQVSVLRKLVADGPMSPATIADELRLARSTISNLVRALAGDGLIERCPSAVDGRSVLLAPTAYGREVLEAFRRERVKVLEAGLQAVPPAELERLAAALPALTILLDEFHRITGEVAGYGAKARAGRAAGAA